MGKKQLIKFSYGRGINMLYKMKLNEDPFARMKKGTKTGTIPASAPYSYSDQKLYILNIGYACTKRITYHI